MAGGRSPDGRSEVRVVREVPPAEPGSARSRKAGYSIQVLSLPFGKLVKGGELLYRQEGVLEMDGAGFVAPTRGGGPETAARDDFAAAVKRCRAVWHDSGEVVAIVDQGRRYSREVSLVRVIGGRADELLVPDYVQNALGRLEAFKVDFASVSSVRRWVADDLLLQLYFTAKRRQFYTLEVTLAVKRDEEPGRAVEIKNLVVPKAQKKQSLLDIFTPG